MTSRRTGAAENPLSRLRVGSRSCDSPGQAVQPHHAPNAALRACARPEDFSRGERFEAAACWTSSRWRRSRCSRRRSGIGPPLADSLTLGGAPDGRCSAGDIVQAGTCGSGEGSLGKATSRPTLRAWKQARADTGGSGEGSLCEAAGNGIANITRRASRTCTRRRALTRRSQQL